MKSKDRWTTSRTAVFNINYHIIFCPKYRKKILVNQVEKRLRELLIKKAEELNIHIKTMEIMPDHVHLFVKAIPKYAPQFIVQQFKGVASKILRDEFPWIKTTLPTLWTRSYYCESIGNISEDTVKKYIENQKTRYPK